MRTKTILMWSGVAILIVGGVALLVASFGGGKAEDSVVEVEAIYTNAAETVAAQQQTLQAGTFVATPIPTMSLPTAALTPLPSPTFQLQTSIPLPTIKPAIITATSCDSAVYVSDVTIPDGTTIPAGEYFTKTWKVSNTGSCAWTATYKLVFVSGDSLGGKATAIGKAVNPGESVDVSVILTSTSATGEIKGTWKLSNDKGQTFGDSLYVVINSGTATPGTVTLTPTITPIVIVVTATYTPTPTPTTIAPTNTPAPTETPTPTPTTTGG